MFGEIARPIKIKALNTLVFIRLKKTMYVIHLKCVILTIRIHVAIIQYYLCLVGL